MIGRAALVLAVILQAPRAEMTRVPQFDNDRATSWLSIIPPHTESTEHRHDRFRSVVAIVGGDLKTIEVVTVELK